MLAPGFYNMDCIAGMKEFPDNYFDLAVVDPPYGDAGAGGGVLPVHSWRMVQPVQGHGIGSAGDSEGTRKRLRGGV